MTFSDTEMKELGRSTQINKHKIIDPCAQVCLAHLTVGRSLYGGRI